MKGRFPLYVAVLAAIAVGVGVALYERSHAPLALRAGTALPEPRALPAFAFVDQAGRPFGSAELEGRWSLVFTGFTHCPDLCPTTLAELADLRKQLPAEALQIVFVSVDPERDTPERIADYLAHFGRGLRGATGTAAQVEAFTGQLGLAHVRNPGVAGDYAVDHSAALVLIDPEARVAGYFTPPHDARALAADLAGLVRGAG